MIRSTSSVVLCAVLAATLVPAVSDTADAATAAPGPGAVSHFGLARKDCLGTARNTTSKAWFTVAGGVLSDVYAPVIDNTNVETLQFAVTDGRSFTDLQARDMTYTVRTSAGGMACEVTSTPRSGRYRLVTEYLADPARTGVLIRTRLEPLRDSGRDLKVYVRFDASVNGNGGGGPANGGGDTATVDAATSALVSADTNTVSSAPARDYGTPLAAALRADRRFLATSSGFAGTAGDGLAQLDRDHRLTGTTPSAVNGNVVQTAQLDLQPRRPAVLALGFGADARAAVSTAGASLRTPFDQSYRQYAREWRDYDNGLIPVRGQHPDAYYQSVNVLKASEDKTFPGAVVASLGSPWGQAVSAGDAPGGKPVYFGSYREIFARDLYESFSGLLAAGDRETARASVRWLFARQQQPDGRFPRNSLLNGKKAPDSGGDQLDESAYPILMALQAGLDRDRTLYTEHIRGAADFVVAHGPAFGSERWEEQGGYSPSTIAAEIAGLVAAGVIADRNGDPARANVYRATADHFQRSIKGWTVTSNGPYGGRYFLRLTKNGDPDSEWNYNLGNGSVDADQRAVVDAGFLELTRLGVLPANDPDVAASLGVVDRVIKRDTPAGPGWYRYGTSAAGSEDGYGDCYEPDPTNCGPTGAPWPSTNTGSGHLWPVLAGERGEQAVQTGDRVGAAALLRAMRAQTGGTGLIPEQIWENPALPAAPYGTDPKTASIGFTPGQSVGSVAPLSWAQSQSVRLARALDDGRLPEQPAEVRSRYVSAPPALTVTLDAPASVSTATARVTGTAPAGSRVDLAVSATDAGTTTVLSTRASAAGTFGATVPTPLGANVVTAAATGAGTGYAQKTISSDFVTGTVLLDATDPDGDDTGPGTYTYPTAGDFHAGAFDLQRFQVIDSGTNLVFRAQVRDLSPTFGSPLGAQLLTVYAHDPAATATSTAAPFPSRAYTIAPQDAWSRRIEVQGFAEPSLVDASGASPATPSVQASQATRYITVSVAKAAFGTPGPGWTFAVVLTGQDGNSPDQARPFTPTAGQYTFGLCAAGGTAPICTADPATAPKALDVLTPSGVDQKAELDPASGPVSVRGVPVG
ncbi:glucodextranase DOMON-like domain-containing protein [Amycolatopsis sp. DG1A-15b]|uniref:glucodextranase DOMON-like domain-containing protein n=1 Tax=Amycolatopsis sp. DG1A-15b TaxID=3052846 RepID=UPI00255C1B81|nr:glucodextranase DOMON-like domain-containing protein [Amycolatopsis sp. DG1A-15b]WIX92682.1 glucodextranase DOMON-like domain-containing protein [Amycolatopsis sp. DG1A-15b]